MGPDGARLYTNRASLDYFGITLEEWQNVDFQRVLHPQDARDLMQALIGSFRKHTQFPSVGGVGPGFVPGIDWSDHWAFEEFHYPAVMITDTAYFRYPHYHKATDTPDKVSPKVTAEVKGNTGSLRVVVTSDALEERYAAE